MTCIQCGWWDRLCHCKDLSLFSTTKDKLYEFTDMRNFGKPVEVRGKGHWNRLLKQHGLTDDISGQRNQNPKIDRSFIKDQVTKELREKNLYHKVFREKR